MCSENLAQRLIYLNFYAQLVVLFEEAETWRSVSLAVDLESFKSCLISSLLFLHHA